MAKSLRVEIALAGTEEVNRQLKSMDETGVKAFNNIAAAAKKVGGFAKLDTGDIGAIAEKAGVKGKEALDQLNKAVETKAHFEKLADAVGLVERALGRAGLAAKALLLVLTPLQAAILVIAVLMGVALVAAAAKAAQALAETERTAIKFGTSFTQLTKIIEGFGKVGIGQDAVIAGLQQLQSQIDKFTLEKVNAQFEEAKKLLAGGWGAEEQIRFLQQVAEQGFGAASDAARKFLAELNRPIRDNVTPLLDAIVRSAGGAAAAIPRLAAEMAGLQTPGERIRFMAEALKRIQIEAGGAANAITPLISAIEAMPAGAERERAVLEGLGQEFGALVVQALRSGKSVREAIESSKGLPEVTITNARQAALALEQLKAAAASVFKNIPLGEFAATMDAAATKVQSVANTVNAITWSGVQQGATAFNEVGTAAGTLNTNVTNVGTAVSAMTGQWSSMGASGNEAVNSINRALDDLISKLGKAIGMMGRLGSGGGGGAIPDAGGFAGGGLMGGRGSGTSDSNLAWLSRGEHIMPARAVRQPGVLQLLESLRRSGGNLRGVLDRMGHFAMGGVVGGGMSNVTIAFPGLPPIGGLRAPGSVVEQLHRAAALAQVRSGGRKPSRYF